MVVECLRADGRRREAQRWPRWLEHVAEIQDSFLDWMEGLDPLRFNETASVAVLANAATLAGYLTLTEYAELKRDLGRGKPFRAGRCDLWIADPHPTRPFCWGMEVKKHFGAKGTLQPTVNSKLAKSLEDAKRLQRSESDQRVGCLLLSPREDVECTEEVQSHFDSLCLGTSADLIYRVSGKAGRTWILFQFTPD